MLYQRLIGKSERKICVVCRLHTIQTNGIVICSGFGMGMSEPRYLLSIIARQCYDLGLNVFQFSYLGDGDSMGSHKLMSKESVLDSTLQVIDFAESLGCSKLGLIGYGGGNIVASQIINDSRIISILLICPYFVAFNTENQKRWQTLLAESNKEAVYPLMEHVDTFIDFIWNAVVGEGIRLFHFSGPLNPSLLQQLYTLKPQKRFLESEKPLLIISNQMSDKINRKYSHAAFKLIKHTKSKIKPTWQWCAKCRDTLTTWCIKWIKEQFQNQKNDFISESNAFAISKMFNTETDYSLCQKLKMHSVEINVKEQKILGILHTPSNRTKIKNKCIIYEYGNPGDRSDIHRCGPRIAKALNGHGYYLFRYDARDNGVSEGDFQYFNWSRRLDDLLHVINHLESIDCLCISSFIILSNSAGAKPAILALNRDQRISKAIMWGPDLSLPSDWKDNSIEDSTITNSPNIIRNSFGKLVTEHCGLWLSAEYSIDENKYNFFDEFKKCSKPILVVFPEDEMKYQTNEKIAVFCENHNEKEIRYASGPHGFSPASIDNTIKITINWLKYTDVT